MSYEKLKEDISFSTTCTPGEVSLIIETLLRYIREGLKAGQSVYLDKFGQFRLSFSSKGVENAKDFNTDLIHGIRVVFHPCKELKPERKNIVFEKKATVTEQKALLKAQLNGGGSNTGGNTGGDTGGGDKPGDESMD